jgi:flagellin
VSALSTVDVALKSVSALRSQFGAQHNRLEFTIQTLAIQEENSTASDSALRDADIARETIRFTRNQILVSSGTSVLAQSNVIPQTALQLLGG